MANRLKLWQRAKLAWNVLRGGRAVKALTVIGKLSSTSGMVDVDPSDVTTLTNTGYKKQEVVYACVRAIATSASDVPVRVTVDGKDSPAHPLAKLLARPWPWLSRYELLEATLTYLSIAGKAFWWKQRSEAGRVVGLYPLRPDLVRIKPGKTLDRPIAYFEYTWGSEVYRFPPEDVVYHRYLDPLSDVGAFPPLAVAMDSVDADNMATRFLQYFFRRGAMLSGVLSTEARLDPDQVDFLKELWKQQYGGLEHWGEVAILSHGAKYQQIGLTHKEMEFPELRKISESRICMVLGVPPILIHALVGLEHATYSNFEQAQRIFWVNTLSPIYGRLADKITVDLGAEFGDDVAVYFAINEVPALQEKRDAAWARADQGVSGGWVTVNEGRAEAGLPPVAGGDVFLRTLAIMPEQAQLQAKALIPALPAFALGEKMAEEAKEAHAQRRDQIARAWEGRFTDRARELFEEEVKALKVLVQERGAQKQAVAWVDVMFSVRELIEARKGNWREGFTPLFRALLGAQAETIAADFGIDFSLDNPLVQDWVAGYAFKFAEKLQDVSIADLAGLIGQAQDEGWSIPKLQDELQGLYDGWTWLRAEMIARTETIRSSNAGAKMSYRAAGVTQLEWWATKDERVCPFCAAMHKRIIGIEESFWKQGQEMVVVLEDGKAVSDLILEFKETRPSVWEWMGIAAFTADRKARSVRLKFTYEDVDHPPLHPYCRCTILPVLSPKSLARAVERSNTTTRLCYSE